MTLTPASTNPYGLGTAKKVGLFVVVDAKSVVRLKEGLCDGPRFI
jgi:hypothetical protein